MQHIKTFVTFESNASDEAKNDGHDTSSMPPGLNLVTIVANALRTRGVSVSVPVQHSFYGWKFDLAFSGHKAWCLLQCPGPWLLLVEERSSRLTRLLKGVKRLGLASVVREIDAALKETDGVSGLQWFTKKEYGVGKGEKSN